MIIKEPIKKSLKTIFFLLGFTSVIGQNNFESISQEFILENPAYFLMDDSYHISLFRKQQFKGFNTNNKIIIQKSINYERLGIGLVFDNNNHESVYNENQLSIPLSYQIYLAKGKLSFGLEPGVLRGVLNGTSLYSPDLGDPYFSTHIYTKAILKVGLFYADDKFTVGLSYRDLMKSKGVLNDDYLSFLIGKTFKLSDRLIYHPLLYFRSKKSNINQVILRNQFEYSDWMLFSVLLNNSKKVTLSIGLDMERIIPRLMEHISVFYSIGKQFKELSNIGVTSEFGLVYVFNPLPSKNKVLKRSVNHSGVLFD